MKKFILLSTIVVILLTGCGGQLATPIPVSSGDTYTANVEGTPIVRQVAEKVCVRPESDNSYQWNSNACVEISTSVYVVKVRVNDEITSVVKNFSQGSATAINGIAVASYRSWQEGKGILPVIVLSINPEFPGVYSGVNIGLKTSDTKAMNLPNGAETVFICNQDVETLSPNQNGQALTEDRQTYELDDCRMKTPAYTIPTPVPVP